jgi:DnaK suppressor protein
MNTEKLEEFRLLLLGWKQSLLKEAAGTVSGMSSESGGFPDPTDRAALECDRNFLLRIRDRERKLIQKIEEALTRIEAGKFGLCESCGGEISEERLRARPVTTLCIDCKTEEEVRERF